MDPPRVLSGLPPPPATGRARPAVRPPAKNVHRDIVGRANGGPDPRRDRPPHQRNHLRKVVARPAAPTPESLQIQLIIDDEPDTTAISPPLSQPPLHSAHEPPQRVYGDISRPPSSSSRSDGRGRPEHAEKHGMPTGSVLGKRRMVEDRPLDQNGGRHRPAVDGKVRRTGSHDSSLNNGTHQRDTWSSRSSNQASEQTQQPQPSEGEVVRRLSSGLLLTNPRMLLETKDKNQPEPQDAFKAYHGDKNTPEKRPKAPIQDPIIVLSHSEAEDDDLRSVTAVPVPHSASAIINTSAPPRHFTMPSPGDIATVARTIRDLMRLHDASRALVVALEPGNAEALREELRPLLKVVGGVELSHDGMDGDERRCTEERFVDGDLACLIVIEGQEPKHDTAKVPLVVHLDASRLDLLRYRSRTLHGPISVILYEPAQVELLDAIRAHAGVGKWRDVLAPTTGDIMSSLLFRALRCFRTSPNRRGKWEEVSREVMSGWDADGIATLEATLRKNIWIDFAFSNTLYFDPNIRVRFWFLPVAMLSIASLARQVLVASPRRGARMHKQPFRYSTTASRTALLEVHRKEASPREPAENSIPQPGKREQFKLRVKDDVQFVEDAVSSGAPSSASREQDGVPQQPPMVEPKAQPEERELFTLRTKHKQPVTSASTDNVATSSTIADGAATNEIAVKVPKAELQPNGKLRIEKDDIAKQPTVKRTPFRLRTTEEKEATSSSKFAIRYGVLLSGFAILAHPIRSGASTNTVIPSTELGASSENGSLDQAANEVPNTPSSDELLHEESEPASYDGGLKAFQQECVDTILKKLSEGVKRQAHHVYPIQAISLPIHSGKAAIIAALIPQIPAPMSTAIRTMILTHKAEEMANAIRKAAPNLQVILDKGGASKVKPEDLRKCQVLIVSMGAKSAKTAKVTKTRADRIKGFDSRLFRFVIVDDAHQATDPTYLKIFDGMGALGADSHLMLLGLSPYIRRKEDLTLDMIFEEITYEKTILDLIEAKHFCRLLYGQVLCDDNLNEVPMRAGDFNPDKLAATLMLGVDRNRRIVDVWQQVSKVDASSIAPRKRCLVYASNLLHVSEIVTAFSNAGIKAHGINASVPPLMWRTALRDFHNGYVSVLVVEAANLLEDIELTGVDCVIMARPTKSPHLVMEMISKGLIPARGKRDCFVIDVIDIYGKDGLVTVPSLFGLPRRFRLTGDDPAKQGGDGGTMVISDFEPARVREAQAYLNQHPGASKALPGHDRNLLKNVPDGLALAQTRAPETLEELRATAEEIDRRKKFSPWTDAKLKDPASVLEDEYPTSEMSELDWVRVGEDAFVLKVSGLEGAGSDGDGDRVVVDRDSVDGRFSALLQRRWKYKGQAQYFGKTRVEVNEKVPFEYKEEVIVTGCDTVVAVMRATEEWLAAQPGSPVSKNLRTAPWKKGGASEGQWNFLKNVMPGIESVINLKFLTKGLANKMLTRGKYFPPRK
ncbi:hypothetical protein HK101_009189 [Irineochytrium annulatum]|nr:hypothetical protein HK101_009189 [Irineochytrium annulatum]